MSAMLPLLLARSFAYLPYYSGCLPDIHLALNPASFLQILGSLWELFWCATNNAGWADCVAVAAKTCWTAVSSTEITAEREGELSNELMTVAVLWTYSNISG